MFVLKVASQDTMVQNVPRFAIIGAQFVIVQLEFVRYVTWERTGTYANLIVVKIAFRLLTEQ